jgi:hypothetical protein
MVAIAILLAVCAIPVGACVGEAFRGLTYKWEDSLISGVMVMAWMFWPICNVMLHHANKKSQDLMYPGSRRFNVTRQNAITKLVEYFDKALSHGSKWHTQVNTDTGEIVADINCQFQYYDYVDSRTSSVRYSIRLILFVHSTDDGGCTVELSWQRHPPGIGEQYSLAEGVIYDTTQQIYQVLGGGIETESASVMTEELSLVPPWILIVPTLIVEAVYGVSLFV